MIHTREHLTTDRTVQADACVIGSGAGGSAAAWRLARAGKKVVVIEAGSFLTPQHFSQREDHMFPKLFYGAGGRRTSDRNIRVLHGHGVGGSTLHNINLCKRVPDEVVAEWKLPRFTVDIFRPYLEQVEKLLAVTPVGEHQVNPSNRLFRAGTQKLGYRGALLHHNRQGCVGSGFCELGCAYDAKMNAFRVLIPEAVKAGAEVFANTRVAALEWSGRRVQRARCEVTGSDGTTQARLTVEAAQFFCAGGAIETPALLQRSDVPDPRGLVGSHLHLHPGVVAAGVFDEKVEAWKGVPQTWECTEFLEFGTARDDKRIWIIGGAAHPAGTASLLPGYGAEHREWMRQYPYFAPLSAMVHDRSRGTVRSKGSDGVAIDYVLNEGDRAQLASGLRESARILLAAGAREVVIPFLNPLRARSIAELEKLDFTVRDHELDIVSVHPMSSVWMGASADDSCLDETGRYHQLDNLRVCDTSVYPTSLGVPPQISTYAVGLYVAEQSLK